MLVTTQAEALSLVQRLLFKGANFDLKRGKCLFTDLSMKLIIEVNYIIYLI